MTAYATILVNADSSNYSGDSPFAVSMAFAIRIIATLRVIVILKPRPPARYSPANSCTSYTAHSRGGFPPFCPRRPQAFRNRPKSFHQISCFGKLDYRVFPFIILCRLHFHEFRAVRINIAVHGIRVCERKLPFIRMEFFLKVILAQTPVLDIYNILQ